MRGTHVLGKLVPEVAREHAKCADFVIRNSVIVGGLRFPHRSFGFYKCGNQTHVDSLGFWCQEHPSGTFTEVPIMERLSKPSNVRPRDVQIRLGPIAWKTPSGMKQRLVVFKPLGLKGLII